MHRILMGIAMVVLWVGVAQAHRVTLFGYVDGNDIVVECGFSRSQKIKQGQLEVLDAATGQVLLETVTDDKGQCRFPIPAEVRASGHDVLIRIKAGEGHQNEWLMSATDLMPTVAVPEPRQQTSSESALVVRQDSKTPLATTSTLTPADVERIVNTALDAKLAPIKHMIAEQQTNDPTLRDIIGGLGWILGLAGIAAYYRRRG